MLAKISGESFITLPSNAQLEDGRWVSNYHLLPVPFLREQGWKDLVEVKPAFDETTHYLELSGVVETEVITATYVAVINPINEVDAALTELEALL